MIVNELIRSSGIYFYSKHASSLSQSIQLCKENDFDIILLDLGLPDSVGLDTLKKLHAATERSPLVVMTGLDDEETALHALREGAQDYLVKNQLTGESIMRTIKYSIERKKIDEVSRLNARRFSILSEATGALNESDDTSSIFKVICASVTSLLDRARVLALEVPEQGQVRVYGAEWLKPHFRDIKKVTGIDMTHPFIQINKNSLILLDILETSHLKEIEGGLFEAFNGFLDQMSCHELEKKLDLEKLYTIGFHQHRTLYGAFVIFSKEAISEDDKRIIETISNQTALNIHRRKIEHHLRISEERYKNLNVELELKVKERTNDLVLLNEKLQKELADRTLAEQALKKNEQELKELNATKDKFFNIVAHDLKNPFTSLLGSTELLFRNLDQLDAGDIRKLAIILNDSAKSGYAILLNLLDWSRSQTGMLRVNPVVINLKEIINENILNLELFSTNKDITIISEVDENIKIFTDQNMLNTILRNLISNALKFSYRSGSVIVKAASGSKEVKVSVKDFGVGVPCEYLGQLFRIDSSYSMPGTEKEQGTGLGLKLSKEFVEKLGGSIWVESEENKGSEFSFVIPVGNT